MGYCLGLRTDKHKCTSKKKKKKTMTATEAAKVKVLKIAKCCTILERISRVGVREERNISLVCYTSTKISIPWTWRFSSYVKVSCICGLFFTKFWSCLLRPPLG